MLIAFQIVLLILIAVFALGTFAEDDKSRTPVYGDITCVAITAMILSFMI